ncbi:hypothetical protein D9M70_590610 [compost metagenome]
MLGLPPIRHALQGMREVLQDDDDGRAAVQQLALQLLGRVQGVDVDHDETGAQRAQHADQVGGHVRHHQRNPRALGQAQALQPGGECPRVGVQLRVGDVATHRGAGDARSVLLAGPIQQVGQGGISLGRDLRRNALRVMGKPRTRHGICLH